MLLLFVNYFFERIFDRVCFCVFLDKSLILSIFVVYKKNYYMKILFEFLRVYPFKRYFVEKI